MNLISKIKIESSSIHISYNDNILFLGSCFSGNIGTKFQERLFSTLVNPFGVIFNPISIFNLLDRFIHKKHFTSKDWLFHNGKWINLDLHGKYSFIDLEQALQESNAIIDNVHEYIAKTDFLFLTYGTSWVYEYIESDKLVANCHKIPQKKFRKRLLTTEEIIQKAQGTISDLKKLNPNVNIINTISPVRHWADGARNNNLSKGILHQFVNEIEAKFNTVYFPSYEIVMDELRDYRFFDADMMHPNPLAIDYVWEKLIEVYIDSKTKSNIKNIEKLLQASIHRPFDSESLEYKTFLKKQLQEIERLKLELENVNFSNIEIEFKSRLRDLGSTKAKFYFL